ncbi:platelet glycoprotein Ib beta chain isoform X2 [Osmerus eperlanus]
MKTMMMGPPLLCVLVLFGMGVQGSSVCPSPCSCQKGQVDCSQRSLTTSSLPPRFPSNTTHLRLHDNLLTSLPNGILDSLPSLRSVSLHGNPWACDCGVLYLRAWLLRQPHGDHGPLNGDGPDHASLVATAGHLHVNCSFPPDLRGRLVVYLTEEEVLDTCHYWYCDLALASQVCLCVFVLLQATLLAAVVVFLRRFERLTREARLTADESLTGGEGCLGSERKPLKDSRF